MAILDNPPSIDQLRRAVEVSEKIEQLKAELESVLGGTSAPVTQKSSVKASKKGKRRGRPPGIKNAISEFLSGATAPKVKKDSRKKRVMSDEGRQKIIDAQKKRWASKNS